MSYNESMLEIIQRIESNTSKVVVLGDLMLDHSVYGKATRISPEAPVPVVHKFVDGDRYNLGGAGNVAANLHALGISFDLLAMIGADWAAGKIFDILKDMDVSSKGLVQALIPSRPTTIKQRFFAENQQLLRVDTEDASDIDRDHQNFLLERLERAVKQKDVKIVIISDYKKGSVPFELCKQAISLSKHYKKTVVIDPKGMYYEQYKGCDFLKLNLKELENFYGERLISDKEINRAANKMKHMTGCRAVIVTLGHEGVMLYSEPRGFRIPAIEKMVYDVVGAGDTFLAALCAALTVDTRLFDAVAFANFCSSIVVGKPDTATVTLAEVKKHHEGGKI